VPSSPEEGAERLHRREKIMAMVNDKRRSMSVDHERVHRETAAISS
jgi:hypothetical protein